MMSMSSYGFNACCAQCVEAVVGILCQRFSQRWQNILGCDVPYMECFEYLYVMDFSVHIFHGVSVWLFGGMIIAVFVCEL